MKPLKHITRRNFIATSIKAAVSIPLISGPILSACSGTERIKPLNILILGGTSFLGPHQIAYALERGHNISTFTRGKTIPKTHMNVFDRVESLIGDRNGKLDALKGRKWDVVIDNSGNKVKWVEDTAELLRDSTDLYLFSSSTGVYFPYLGTNIEEETELLDEIPENIEQFESMAYGFGVMKTNAEKAVRKFLGKDRSLIVRPTYMMGPGDTSDRFTYWPERLSMGGDILVPGKHEDPVQYIDARDVAEWMIRLAERGVTGNLNAVGPVESTNMKQFIYEAETAFEVEKTFTFINDYDFLEKKNIYGSVPWIMPVGNDAGSALVSNAKGIENGLTIRPLIQSVKDIHSWWHSEVIDEDRRNELMTGKRSLGPLEKTLLKEWRELQNTRP